VVMSIGMSAASPWAMYRGLWGLVHMLLWLLST
jgi:hypothetical protein